MTCLCFGELASFCHCLLIWMYSSYLFLQNTLPPSLIAYNTDVLFLLIPWVAWWLLSWCHLGLFMQTCNIPDGIIHVSESWCWLLPEYLCFPSCGLFTCSKWDLLLHVAVSALRCKGCKWKLQGLIKPHFGRCIMSFLLHLLGQCNSQSQPNFKGREKIDSTSWERQWCHIGRKLERSCCM